MKRIRYLTLLMLLFSGSIGLWAQDDFNPVSPAEPGPPGSESGQVPMLTLVADPSDGGTVTGAGWYDVGSQVTLKAYNKANFVFTNWTNAQGEVVSTTSQFKYTKLTGNETLTAHFRFSPGSPAEPVEIAQLIYHQLTVKAEEGGSVSGGGKYLPNTSVKLSASVNIGYSFVGWFDNAGELVSSTSTFYYTTTAAPVTLTARFAFTPSNPGEPVTPVFTKYYKVTATAEEGGTVNTTSTSLAEGKTVTLTATSNTGYVFSGWYVNNTLYTSSSSFTYTMGTADIAFEARFTFNPSSPSDPSETKMKSFTFTLYNRVCKPGDTIKFPVYLTTTEDLIDMQFQLTFPKEIVPEVQMVDISEKAEGYTVSLEKITDPEALSSVSVDENATVYTLSFTGGQMAPGNTVLLNFTVHIDAEISTGQGYPVRINQVAMTLSDGTKVTAATRNGRISVYKRGDANGDDVVDALDAALILHYVAHKFGDENTAFIKEAADTNDGNEIDALDASLVLQHAAKKIDLNTMNQTE